jgi:Zn-dependent M28 family amino/carboxypeptidase
MNYLKYCVKILAADSMGGREAGSKQAEMASLFITGEFQKAKISPFLTDSYFQDFTYKRDSAVINASNIIARIDNKAPSYIIITSHYDHIGYGGRRSRSYGKHEVHNGADDDASGVAMMLSLAKAVKASQVKKFNFIFIAFSGHEDGLFGSDFFANNSLKDGKNIKLMINLDMVGRADTMNPELFIAGNDSSMTSEFIRISSGKSQIKLKNKQLPQGDHSVFASLNIPIMFFTTGMEDDYHKVTDDESLINYKAMGEIEKVILDFIIKAK